MNDLKDFDFFIDYVYTYCSRHLKEDGWSSQEWEQAVNSYKNKLEALEIIKDWLNLKVVELLPNNIDTRLFVECGNFKAGISIPPAYIDLLKEALK